MTKNMRTLSLAAIAALMMSIAIIATGALAVAATEKQVEALDEVYFDGSTLKVAYTLQSRCRTADHDASIKLESLKTSIKNSKTIIGFNVNVFDIADESSCSGRLTTVLVNKSLNLAEAVDNETTALARKGYRVDADYTLNLPPVRPPLPDDGYSNRNDDNGMKDYGGGGLDNTPAPTAPTKAMVKFTEYTPGWSCILRKNDGARKDGFKGQGATIDEARSQAARGCARTNHPECSTFAYDPAHTTCDITYTTTETLKEFDSTQVPAGATLNNWSCTLNKADGSANSTFTGTAAAESSARAEAATACRRTNFPKCDAYALDDRYTVCAASYSVEGKKPVPVWSCILWKNDGARKDGFKGQGNTQQEALQESIQGCATTNNPYCMQYSIDPKHTKCEVQFATP